MCTTIQVGRILYNGYYSLYLNEIKRSVNFKQAKMKIITLVLSSILICIGKHVKLLIYLKRTDFIIILFYVPPARKLVFTL